MREITHSTKNGKIFLTTNFIESFGKNKANLSQSPEKIIFDFQASVIFRMHGDEACEKMWYFPDCVDMSHYMRKLDFCLCDFCLCENKGADQLQQLCFCYLDSTIPLLPKSEFSSF